MLPPLLAQYSDSGQEGDFSSSLGLYPPTLSNFLKVGCLGLRSTEYENKVGAAGPGRASSCGI